MVDKNIIVSKIEQIDNHLKKISSYKKLSYEEFLKDAVAQDVIEYNLFQITNHIISIIQHIVVDEEYGLPKSSYEAAQILFEKGILEGKDLELLKKMIGFRNVVGHDYANINKEIVYSILKEKITDIEAIISKIAKKFL
jgi:uncharacterized protein YutE (UPF0331/DUF86 family)